MLKWVQDSVDVVRRDVARERQDSLPSAHGAEVVTTATSEAVATWAAKAPGRLVATQPGMSEPTKAFLQEHPAEALAWWCLRQQRKGVSDPETLAAKLRASQEVTGETVAFLLRGLGFARIEAVFAACLALAAQNVKPEEVERFILSCDGRRVKCEVELKE
jgi:hypothetical protein